MLEALKYSGISSVCVCVVRYFGGIKLGPGGLIRAYAGAVKDVLEAAKKVEDIPLHQYSITYPYDLSGTLEGWLRRNTEITDMQYSDAVTAVFETERDDIPQIIQDLSHGSVAVKDQGIVYREKEV
jgi:putative IMPACT (imprinted ancient) family translation regulator